MRPEEVQIWLDRYVAAWASYDPQAIGDLFAEDAEYRYHPYDEPVVGREAIVADWLANQDDPGSWTAHYDVWAVEGDRASAIGESRYTNPDGSFRTLFFNNWTMRFDGHGRCVEFVEYFIELPERLRTNR
jgi:ketosteroid isomerase-like protein